MDQDCNARDCTSVAVTSLSLAVSVCSMNKPDPAMVRPDRVSACIEFGISHVIYMERQMDKQTKQMKRQSY